MALSEAKIRTVKSSTKLRKLSDGGGLQLWITPAGGKHWKLAYRHGRPAKQRLLPLRAYPAVGLAGARLASIEARILLARGVDPVERRNADKASKARGDVWTFDTVATVTAHANSGQSQARGMCETDPLEHPETARGWHFASPEKIAHFIASTSALKAGLPFVR
jgi:Arm DNA-binding domain